MCTHATRVITWHIHERCVRCCTGCLQVQRVDAAKSENEAAMALLQERINALTPADLSPGAVQQQLAAPQRGGRGKAGTSKGGSKAKGAKDAAAAAAAAALPLPAPPLIPAHFKPYTFHFPGMEPFEVRGGSSLHAAFSCASPSKLLTCGGWCGQLLSSLTHGR